MPSFFSGGTKKARVELIADEGGVARESAQNYIIMTFGVGYAYVRPLAVARNVYLASSTTEKARVELIAASRIPYGN